MRLRGAFWGHDERLAGTTAEFAEEASVPPDRVLPSGAGSIKPSKRDSNDQQDFDERMSPPEGVIAMQQMGSRPDLPGTAVFATVVCNR